MAINRTSTFTGQERRAGFERRAVAPRENANAPRLLTSVDVPGFGTFGPGQEKAFSDAVEQHNKQAREQNRPEINVGLHEARGNLRNFVQAGLVTDLSRSHQLDPKSLQEVAVENPGRAAIPGGMPLEQAHPLPVAVEDRPETVGPVHEQGGETTVTTGSARRGGAGRTSRGGSRARGERSRAGNKD